MRIERLPIGPGQESVWSYPRPPRIESTSKLLEVILAGKTIARTRRGHRVLETSHPPVYYFPVEDVNPAYLRKAGGKTMCEWKGAATYFDVIVGDLVRQRAAWSYANPTPESRSIANAVAFYASLFDRCTVDGQLVTPQPGGFYGGWVTPDIVGPFKGGPGSMGW